MKNWKKFTKMAEKLVKIKNMEENLEEIRKKRKIGEN